MSIFCIKKKHPTLLSLVLLITSALASDLSNDAFQSALDQENIIHIQELLASHNLDINMQNQEGNTALMLAIVRNHATLVEKLIERNDVNVNLQYEGGHTALMLAIRENYIPIAELLLRRSDLNINLQDKLGHTALMLAIRKNHITLAQLLLKRDDINVNVQDVYAVYTSLMLAIRKNHIILAQLLLQRDDINVNLQSTFGYTALMLAVDQNHISIAQLLLQRDDIDVNIKDRKNKNALAHITNRHINLDTSQSDHIYYISLVKRTRIPSLHKNHALLQPNYLQALYAQQPFSQAMKQYTDILVINKIHHKLQTKQRPLFYQGCLLAYETKNSNYSIQAKDIASPQTLSHYQPILDQDLKKLLTGYLRKVNMKRVSYESDWAHYIACYLWANNQFAIEYNPNTMTLQEIHFWHKHNSLYPEWLDAANHTQERALFKIVYQKGKYQAVATQHLAQGLKQKNIIQKEEEILEKSITQVTSIIVAGLKALNHQLITS